jgi:uncharacterized protein
MTQTRSQARQAGQAGAARGARLPWHVRLLLRQRGRAASQGQPPPVCDARLERGVRVPMADGVTLLADHYWPVIADPAPTVLVRCPYGRGFPYDFMYGGMLARQGFHVLIQSCRGTAGSGGVFEPFVDEAADGQATVAWLRGQDWFNGALGTIGASYLGFTQWALAADPPPELKAMVIQVSSDDFYGFLYPGGAFALEAALTGVTAMVAQQRGVGAFLLAILRLWRQHGRVARSLPFLDAYPAATGQRVGWFDEWLAHPGAADPFWNSRRAGPDLAAVPPVSLLGGWADVCVDPTLDLYQRLRAAGREVRLVFGPWNHTSGFNQDMPVVFGEALRWLRAHLDEAGGGSRAADAADAVPRAGTPARVWVGAAGPGTRGASTRGKGAEEAGGGWRDLADWPPPGTRTSRWRLTAGRLLVAADAEAGGPDGASPAPHPAPPAVSAFRYDPRDPTPSVGGATMGGRTGTQRNDALEARPDVVTFTSAPLDTALETAGPVSVRLRARGSTPYFDVFARLCDVDPAGRSWNVCDGLLRISDGEAWTELTVPMSSAAHRFSAGHQVRLQLSGGAHPRFARNTGTGEPVATATAGSLIAVDIEIAHDPGRPGELFLPVQPG